MPESDWQQLQYVLDSGIWPKHNIWRDKPTLWGYLLCLGFFHRTHHQTPPEKESVPPWVILLFVAVTLK